jgi:uncharacterized protein (DUF1330 family)
MPKAYMAGFVKVRDRGWLDEYRPKCLALVEKHGGRYLAAGFGPELLEGRVPVDILVVLEFPSVDAAKAWYADPEYQPLIELRQSGSDIELAVAEGLV